MNQFTGAEKGLSGEQQVKIALKAILDNGGTADMSVIYKAVEQQMSGSHLSKQGQASLRGFINTLAVEAGYIYPYDKIQHPKVWRITPEGKAYAERGDTSEEVIEVDTGSASSVVSNSIQGQAFELYILDLLKKMYPDYSWYHQGVHKQHERGLDIIGTLVVPQIGAPETIGAQVKYHNNNIAPAEKEWLKFLSGCFARRIDKAVFITTGRLTGEQRREAGEAKIVVIEGKVEIERIAHRFGINPYVFYNFV